MYPRADQPAYKQLSDHTNLVSVRYMTDNKPLPSYAYLPPEDVQIYTRLTDEGTYDLLPAEIKWKERYRVLERQGYKLRLRYHPDWSPSWIGTNRDPTYCEDSVILTVSTAWVSLSFGLTEDLAATRY